MAITINKKTEGGHIGKQIRLMAFSWDDLHATMPYSKEWIGRVGRLGSGGEVTWDNGRSNCLAYGFKVEVVGE